MSSPGMDDGREETADAEALQTRKEVVNGTRQVLKAFKEFSTKLDARRQDGLSDSPVPYARKSINRC